MEQLIKKFNMIDILGMLVPGGLMLLLFENEFNCLNCLTEIIGAGAENVLWIAIFLCGSYLVGIILHG